MVHMTKSSTIIIEWPVHHHHHPERAVTIDSPMWTNRKPECDRLTQFLFGGFMVRLLHLRVKIWLLQLNCHSVRNATAPSDQVQALANGHTAIIVNLFCPQYAADQGFVRSFKFDFKSIHISCDRQCYQQDTIPRPYFPLRLTDVCAWGASFPRLLD